MLLMPESNKTFLKQRSLDNTVGQAPIEDANARLTALLDATVDALIIIDGKGNVELFNAAAQRMFLYSSQEVLGKNIKLLMTNISPLIWLLAKPKLLVKAEKLEVKSPMVKNFPYS